MPTSPQYARTHLTIPGALSGTFIFYIFFCSNFSQRRTPIQMFSDADVRKVTTLDVKAADGSSEPTGIKLPEGWDTIDTDNYIVYCAT